jgi:ABC-type transport system substrate-binding protein
VRPAIVFSDGTPLTAELVARSLSRADVVKEAAAVQSRDDKVVFTLKAPNPRFDLLLTLKQCSVVLDKGMDLLGTGPYMPAPGAGLDALRLVRNPRYRGQAPIDEVQFKVYPANRDGKPEELLRAILEVFGDPQRRASMGVFAREKVQKEYSLESTADRLVELYRQVSAPDRGNGSQVH